MTSPFYLFTNYVTDRFEISSPYIPVEYEDIPPVLHSGPHDPNYMLFSPFLSTWEEFTQQHPRSENWILEEEFEHGNGDSAVGD